MQRCSGNRVPGLIVLSAGAVLAVVARSLFVAGSRPAGTTMEVILGFCLCALTAVCSVPWGVWLLGRASLVYTWDEHGLTRSTWFGRQTLAWRDVLSYQVGRGGDEPCYQLIGRKGRVVIDFGVLKTAGRPLLDDLRRQLEPLRQRKLAQMAQTRIHLGPTQPLANGSTVAAGVLLLLITAAVLPCLARAEDRHTGLLLGGLLAFIAVMVPLARHEQRSLIGSLEPEGVTFGQGHQAVTVPWVELERLEFRRAAYEGYNGEALFVCAGDRRATLSAQELDYLLWVESIAARAVNAEVIDRSVVRPRPIWAEHLRRAIAPRPAPHRWP